MFPDAFIPLGQVPATASRLERAAVELRSRAGSPPAVPSLPLTLSHLEAALDELGTCMRQLAAAAVEWSDPDGAIADKSTLTPEVRALIWHLRAVADTLGEARGGCLTSREWAHRMLEGAATARDADTNAGSRRQLPGRESDRLGIRPQRDRAGGPVPASHR